MTLTFGRHVRIDPSWPEKTALCQRCGDLYNRCDLHPQYRWAGTSLVDSGLKVCQRCLDIPNPNERVIILPPDPPPTFDALQNAFPMDEVTPLLITNTFITIDNTRLTIDLTGYVAP